MTTAHRVPIVLTALVVVLVGLLLNPAPASADPPSDNAFPISGRTWGTAGCTDNFVLGGHEGTDCFAPHGTALVAVESGTIEYATPQTSPFNCSTRTGDRSGNRVSLTGNSGYRYYYGHLDGFAVQSGQPVTKGQVIGYLGATGNAACSTPHLHMQISHVSNRTPLRPAPYMQQWGGSTGGPTPNPNLPWVLPGQTGAAVRCVQNGINVISGAGLAVDGQYGPRTTQAVKNVQAWVQITVDGKVGPQTGTVIAQGYDQQRGAGAWAATGCMALVPSR